jgi:tRNA threonylcarbamoyladenosine biosynthesis protein TsaB
MSTAMEQRKGTRVLSIDTSTRRGSISLLERDEVVAGLRIASPATHSGRLLRGVDFLLSNVGWALRDIELVASCRGPGSFTGVRIGMSTALGLAQTLEVPLAVVTSLDAVAYSLRSLEGRLAVVMDAQRTQVYYAEYAVGDGRIRRDTKPRLTSPERVSERIRRRRLHVAGDGVAPYAEILGVAADGWPHAVECDLFLADEIGRLAQQRRRQWHRGAWLTAEPLYIRPPDAARPRKGSSP